MRKHLAGVTSHSSFIFFLLLSHFFLISPSSGKAERTREFVLDGMKQAQDAFQEHDLIANMRLETYDGEKYFHVPPTSK